MKYLFLIIDIAIQYNKLLFKLTILGNFNNLLSTDFYAYRISKK